MAYQEKDRDKWNKILIYDIMSSEESGKDDLEEECNFCEKHPLAISLSKQVFGGSR